MDKTTLRIPYTLKIDNGPWPLHSYSVFHKKSRYRPWPGEETSRRQGERNSAPLGDITWGGPLGAVVVWLVFVFSGASRGRFFLTVPTAGVNYVVSASQTGILCRSYNILCVHSFWLGEGSRLVVRLPLAANGRYFPPLLLYINTCLFLSNQSTTNQIHGALFVGGVDKIEPRASFSLHGGVLSVYLG